jgi:hypothetical protein
VIVKAATSVRGRCCGSGFIGVSNVTREQEIALRLDAGYPAQQNTLTTAYLPIPR